jgi:hypothetical protein
MKTSNTVRVTIDRSGKMITVSNDKGRKWTFVCEDSAKIDDSNTACIASVATQMLVATINSHLQHSDADTLVYTLIVEPNPQESKKI